MYNNYCATQSNQKKLWLSFHQVTVPGAKPASTKAEEDATYQLAEAGRIHRVEFVVIAVPQVVAVHGTPRQRYTLRRLVVLQQPLDL